MTLQRKLVLDAIMKKMILLVNLFITILHLSRATKKGRIKINKSHENKLDNLDSE